MFAGSRLLWLLVVAGIGLADSRAAASADPQSAALVAELNHDNIHRRNAAVTLLTNRPPQVRLLLRAVVRYPRSRRWVRRVLQYWAATEDAAHTELFTAAEQGGKQAAIARVVLDEPAVRRAQARRAVRTMCGVGRVAAILAATGGRDALVAAGHRAVIGIRICGPPVYVRWFLPPPEADDDDATPSDIERIAEHLLQIGQQASAQKRYDLAYLCARVAAMFGGEHIAVARNPFRTNSSTLTFIAIMEARAWRGEHGESPAIGIAATATLRQLEAQQQKLQERADLWKYRFAWPARTLIGWISPDLVHSWATQARREGHSPLRVHLWRTRIDPDPWSAKNFMSKKALEIERNLGIDH